MFFNYLSVGKHSDRESVTVIEKKKKNLVGKGSETQAKIKQ